MSVFVGINISKAKFDVALLRAGKYKSEGVRQRGGGS